ncbi:ankyrin repeat domain-containing protein [soil metagenome]
MPDHPDPSAGPSAGQRSNPAPDDDRAAAELADRLLDAARQGDTTTLVAYLDAGAPVELSATTGDTLVMLAAYHGHAGTVAALVERGRRSRPDQRQGPVPAGRRGFQGPRSGDRRLVGAGADADAGHPSARATATVFERTDLLARLDAR